MAGCFLRLQNRNLQYWNYCLDVYKRQPVNKIRLFEHGAPGSQHLKLTRKYYTEDMPDGRVKHIVQNITDPEDVYKRQV